MLKKGLKYALREEIYPSPPTTARQDYPLNIEFILYFLHDFLESDQGELDEEDKQKILTSLSGLENKRLALTSSYKNFYYGHLEREFSQQNDILSPLNEKQAHDCWQWAQKESVQLRASKELTDLLLFDLLCGLSG